MKFKSLLAAAIVAAGTSTAIAHATPTWSVTTQGIISSGSDNSNLFGMQGQSLVGLGYTQTITASVDQSQYPRKENYSWKIAMYGDSSLPTFTDTVTVNGKTASFTITNPVFEEQMIVYGLTTKQSFVDEVLASGKGYDNRGNMINGESYAYSFTTAFIFSLDFNQVLVQNLTSGYTSLSRFSVTGANTANFNGTISVLKVNANAVPEPASTSLLGLGLLGLGVMRRRKAR